MHAVMLKRQKGPSGTVVVLEHVSSALKTNNGESVTISFGKIKPGQYPFHCTPHLALGMKGVITVQ